MTMLFRKRRTIAAACILVGCLAGATAAGAQDVRVHVSADSVTVGQRFFLSIAAEHDFAADPRFPEPSDSLVFGDLEVLRRHARDSFARGDVRIDSVVYEVTTFALDTAFVEPIPVLFTAGEDTFSVRTPEEIVHVVSLVPAETQHVRELAPLVEFPRPIWPYVAGGAILLLLAALLAFYLIRRRRRRPAEPPPPPQPQDPADVEALNRLKALEEMPLDDPATAQPFYTELSDTLRHYLARRLRVNAMEMTTRELVSQLSQRQLPASDTRRRLEDVLLLSDYVKFADAVPAPERGYAALGTARGIITSVEDELRPKEAAPSSSARSSTTSSSAP